MKNRTPAEIFPPGDFLKEELEKRQWSQQELADILDRPPRLISEIVSGKRAITPETAIGLSMALGSSAEYWLQLEGQYQLSKVKIDSDTVERKALLYAKFPVRELLRRGWIEQTPDLSKLERRFCDFFGISDVSETPRLSHAARKTHAHREATVEQLAWLCRVRTLASSVDTPAHSSKKLEAAIEQLKELRLNPEDAAKVPSILEKSGVRLVFVEPIAGSKIDGACFWLDGKPVIGMTLRFDRIDNFWFVLRHELEHVLREDAKEEAVIDTELGGGNDQLSNTEQAANSAAADFCASQSVLDRFVELVSPYFSEEKVLALADELRVHPGLVVGQLQRRLGRYDFLRKHQVKVRSFALQSARADGWGLVFADR